LTKIIKQPKNEWGTTDLSEEFCEKHLEEIGIVKYVSLSNEPNCADPEHNWFHVRIVGKDGELWLYGFSWGYGGSGPSSLLWLLREKLYLDVDMQFITSLEQNPIKPIVINVDYNLHKLEDCVRFRNGTIQTDETHLCWFCGKKIDHMSLEYKCNGCNIKKCSRCGKCYCDGTAIEKSFLYWIHNHFCCDEENLRNFNGIVEIPSIYEHLNTEMILNAEMILKQCVEDYRNS